MLKNAIQIPILSGWTVLLLMLSALPCSQGQEPIISVDLLDPVFSLAQQPLTSRQNQPTPTQSTPPTPTTPPDRPSSTKPRVSPPTTITPFNTSPFSRSSRRPIRLASVPSMIGDFFGGAGSSSISTPLYGTPMKQMILLADLSAIAQGGGNHPVDFASISTPPSFGGVSFPPTGTVLYVSQVSLDDIRQNVMMPGDSIPATITPITLQTIISGNNAMFGPGVTSFDGGKATLITGGPPSSGLASTSWDLNGDFTFTPIIGNTKFSIPSPGAGGAGAIIGRMKIAENNSPLPRDRVFINYSYFHHVPLAIDGVDVNRFTPGFEKTFHDGQSSIELRFPFASTLDSNLLADGVTGRGDVEFGNVTVALKSLILESEMSALSTGLAIVIPTADNLDVGLVNGTPLVSISNEAVHLMPFLGGIHSPTEQFFMHGFLQFDFDTNGNKLLVNTDGSHLSNVGRVNDVTFLYLDLGAGWRLFDDPYGETGLTAITPTIEIHYNRSLQATDVIRSGSFQIGNFAENIEVLNIVAGTTLRFGRQSFLTIGFSTPLGGDTDRQFDGELRILFNQNR